MIFVWLTFGGAFLVAREGGHLGMNMVVERLGIGGRWWCRFFAECLSIVCMVLLVVGCWRQTLINLDNHAPITGVPLAVIYVAGLVCGLGIAVINVLTLWRLVSGQIPPDQLIIGVESEELASVDFDRNRPPTP